MDLVIFNPPQTDIPWLQTLDFEICGIAQDALALKERMERVEVALSRITPEMAQSAGYVTVEDLVSRRYVGAFQLADQKVVQPALRRAGFSQSATALMCGVSAKKVADREYRKNKKNDQALRQNVEKDQLPSPGAAIDHLTALAACTERQIMAAAVQVFGQDREVMRKLGRAMRDAAERVGQ